MIYFKKIVIFFFLAFLCSCAVNQTKKPLNVKEKKYYSSSGFALIYSNLLFDQGILSKKLDNEKIVVFHSNLTKNTSIKIINPENSISLETKVTKKTDYPKIFNAVISKKIAKILKLNYENPYVEIREIKKNKTFVAKETNTFDEEKTVALKVPVDQINIKDLNTKKSQVTKKKIKYINFYLLISDFYYYDSANNLKTKLNKQTKSDKFYVEKINDNKYRLSAGPFKNFYSLKSIYISLNELGFDDLNIYRK